MLSIRRRVPGAGRAYDKRPMIGCKNEAHEELEGRRQVKVLVVDDHPLVREALRQVLTVFDNNVELIEAASASDALAVAAQLDHIGLTLLDIKLPGGCGLDLLRELRARCPAAPIVVISAVDDADTIIEALDAGAMGYIPKTSPREVLVAALRLVFSGGVYLPPAVLHHPSAPADIPRPNAPTYRDLGLTQRQSEVLALLVQGKSNKLICRELNLAEGTVRVHITAILKALQVMNRTQAVIAVSKLGLKL